VLEKEPEVGRHQTGHNSGVVHAGLYYQPGSLKAQLCTRGRRLLQEFCADSGLPYIECGKLVVARDESELAPLAAIEKRATANGVPGLQRFDGPGLRRIEPNAAGVAALHSPHTAITDFAAVARALAASLDVRTSTPVVGIETGPDGVRLRTPAGVERTDLVVICAGLHSDTLARSSGTGTRIVPFRGEYWRLRPDRSDLVRGLIYPVSDPRYPFLGVHLTRRVDGAVDLGPNAVLGLSREAYRRRDVDLRWVAAAARDAALWRMARAHWRTGLHEMAGSLSKQVFVRRAATLLPGLRAADVVRAPAGVRAQAVDDSGALVDDFRISRAGQVVTVLNAPSPAATSSLAVAEYISRSLSE
jgi:L-2-hydroxyglutarate oxidase